MYEVENVQRQVDQLDDKGKISDGSHTFDELYYHRMVLFSLVCDQYRDVAWKSWKHDDGTMYPDYFIVGITTPDGDYSYHYHKDHWDKFDVIELEKAPKWDGHTPDDINRLYSLLGSAGKLDSWLKNEIDIACKNEDGYGKSIYNSAAKAYMSLANDGHTGFTIGIARSILNRMIMHKPLKPLTGEDNEWNDITEKRDEYVCYQNKRCPSVFKYVYSDGRLEYSDNDQYIFVNINNDSDRFHNGFLAKQIRSVMPIIMPYSPRTTPIPVYVEEFLCDEKNGDYDTQGIYYLMDGDKKININRFFTEKNREWKEITKEEYLEMRKRRLNKEW